jgi:hypothetical protein
VRDIIAVCPARERSSILIRGTSFGSLVGLIPLFAVERLELEWIGRFKEFTAT